MIVIVEVIFYYLAIGVVALLAFDYVTGRVRSRLKTASYMTQAKLIGTGSLVGVKLAMVLTLIALWIFWPLVFLAAIRTRGKGE